MYYIPLFSPSQLTSRHVHHTPYDTATPMLYTHTPRSNTTTYHIISIWWHTNAALDTTRRYHKAPWKRGLFYRYDINFSDDDDGYVQLDITCIRTNTSAQSKVQKSRPKKFGTSPTMLETPTGRKKNGDKRSSWHSSMFVCVRARFLANRSTSHKTTMKSTKIASPEKQELRKPQYHVYSDCGCIPPRWM